MIKKLKIKFILNSMLLVSIVIITIFSALGGFIYATEENKINIALTNNIKFAQSVLPHIPNKPSEHNDLVYDVSLVMLIDNNGKVLQSTNTDLSNSTIEKIIGKLLKKDSEKGIIREMNLSYSKTQLDSGILVSLISREHLNTRMQEYLIRSLVTIAVSLLLFLYISKRLANIAISPVEKAWDQQKQFLADASHDLKTPLTVILANNNIIASHKEQTVESQIQWIESTSEEAGRMSDLINKMLELAKGEAAKEELTFAETNLSETVENSMLQFEVVAFERKILIESNIQPNIILKTHRASYSKILEILFDNAIKYSNENETVYVSLSQSSKKVSFTINNKGEYIPADDLPHIFERFYRTSKEREVGGHGLGLSIAKKKCDMIGAKISVESSKENGTTFTVTLKAKK